MLTIHVHQVAGYHTVSEERGGEAPQIVNHGKRPIDEVFARNVLRTLEGPGYVKARSNPYSTAVTYRAAA